MLEKSTEGKPDRTRLVVIINGGGGEENGNESPKLGVREVFLGGSVSHDAICVSGSVVVSKEAYCQRGPHHRGKHRKGLNCWFIITGSGSQWQQISEVGG